MEITKKSLTKKIIGLLPSATLREYIRATGHEFCEKTLLKFIVDFEPHFEERLILLDAALNVFEEKRVRDHAAALIKHYRREYDLFTDGGDAVYEISIKCNPDEDAAEAYITKTFDDALKLIRCYLKRYGDIGEVDNERAIYTIRKKTTIAPKRPSDIDKTVGELGSCTLGHKLRILDLDVYNTGNEFKAKCDYIDDCDKCENVCMLQYDPKYPHFLDKFDLVAYNMNDALHEFAGGTEYGVLFCDMDESDSDSYVIMLGSECIKNRTATDLDDGYYKIFNAHEHPRYAVLYKPDITEVPQEVLKDYEYTVGALKLIEAAWEKEKSDAE